MSPTVSIAAFLAFGALAAASDIWQRKVPNELVLGGLIVGLGVGSPSILMSLAGVGVGLALLLPLFAARWIGGGDVKLLAAMGAWLGPWGILVGGLYGIALGGILSVIMAIAGGATREVAANLSASVVTMTAPVAPKRRRALVVPMAVPLAIGGAIVLLGGPS